MDNDLEDRITNQVNEIQQEVQEFTSRLVLATDPAGQWSNHIEARLYEQKRFLVALMTEAIAAVQRDFKEIATRVVREAMAQRVRGTFSAAERYNAGDLVAIDGGSFVAKTDNPGACPNSGNWQLVARQGARGIAGERGPAGHDAPTISGWRCNREDFTVVPLYSNGGAGPALDLRWLVEEFQPESRP
jgi:hypothetical protein